MRWLALLTAWPLVLGSVVRRVEPNGAVRPMVTLEVNTCEDQRSSSTCRYEKDDGEKRIAVYTYVTGAYEEVRDFKVPCVPPGVDAFFLIDDETRRAAKPSNLEHWRRQGWWVLTMLPQIEATPEVPLARLAAKSLKFAPPSWLLNGTWDWLVEFDGDISVDLGGLRALVDEHSDKPLLLLKWYWRQCAPWDCFVQECDDMLTKRRDYVKTSYEKVVKWKEELTKYHNDPLKPFLPADYYELGIIFRQVSHPGRWTWKSPFARCWSSAGASSAISSWCPSTCGMLHWTRRLWHSPLRSCIPSCSTVWWRPARGATSSPSRARSGRSGTRQRLVPTSTKAPRSAPWWWTR